jgi:hypothetical protein
MSFFPRSIALVSKKLTKILSSTTPWTCTGWEECYDDDDDDTAQTTESDCIENGSATLVTTLDESSSTLLLPLAPTTQSSSSNSSIEEVVRPNQAIVDDRRDDDNNKSSGDNDLKAVTTNGDNIALGEASRQPPQQARECSDDNIEKETSFSSTVTNRKSNALRPALRIKTQDNYYYDTSMTSYRSRSSSSSKPRTTILRTTAHDYQTTFDGGGGYDYETHRPRMIRHCSRNSSSSSSSSSYSGSSKHRTMDSSSSISSNNNRRYEKGSSSSSRTATHRHPHSSRRRHHKQQHVRTSNNNNRSYTIQFDPSVIVISIPSHRDYTPATWSALHSTEYETLSSIERNTKEFTYEGWDWKCVIEEEDMVFDSSVGKFIHPLYYNIQAATTTTTTTNNTAATAATTARGASSSSSSSNNS